VRVGSIAVAVSATDWSVVLAALSAKDRLACRKPAPRALNATLTVQLRVVARVNGSGPQPCVVIA